MEALSTSCGQHYQLSMWAFDTSGRYKTLHVNIEYYMWTAYWTRRLDNGHLKWTAYWTLHVYA